MIQVKSNSSMAFWHFNNLPISEIKSKSKTCHRIFKLSEKRFSISRYLKTIKTRQKIQKSVFNIRSGTLIEFQHCLKQLHKESECILQAYD